MNGRGEGGMGRFMRHRVPPDDGSMGRGMEKRARIDDECVEWDMTRMGQGQCGSSPPPLSPYKSACFC